jgi:hypothetical protein
MSVVMNSLNNAGQFRPTNIANCILWLDAADVSTLNLTGSTVNTWTDKASSIPFGRKNGTGITYSNSLVNLASGSFLKNNSGSVTIGQTFTFFLVASNTSGTQAAAIYLSSLASGSPGIYVEWTTTTNYRYTYRFPVGQGGGLNVLIPTAAVIPLTIGTFYREVLGANYRLGMGINGSLTPTTAVDTQSGPLGACSQLAFGTNYQNDNTTDRPLTGAIAEIIVYNGELTPSQREQVEGYLAWKWGLQINLPELHPYDNLPTLTLTTTNQFQPNYLSQCQFWYDANDLTTITLSNSNVTNWNDKSGNGRNLARVFTPGPFLTSNFNGSFRCLETISASNGGMTVNNVPSSAMQGSTGSTYFLTFNYSSGVIITQYGEPRFISMEGSNRYDYGPLGSNVVYNLASGATYTSPQIFCLALNATGSNLTSFQNGVQNRSDSVVPITIAYTRNLGIFGGTDGGLPSYMRLGEFIGYNRLLSTSERQQVEGYLAWKWGLQGSLPSTHPYVNQSVYFFSPTINQLTIPRSIRPAFFLPTFVPNAIVWVDAADSTTVQLSGSTVTSIRDKSATGALFDQGANKPTYGVWLNGLNAMNFQTTTTGGIATTTTTPYNSITQFTVFVVNRPTYASGSIGYAAALFGIRNTTTTQISWHLQANYSSFTAWNGSTTANTTVSVTQNENNLFCIVQSASSFIYVKNGTPTAPINYTITARTGLPFNIGNSGSGTEAFLGNIGEIIFYSRAITEIERQAVEGYLSWKWGLETNLPVTHPFRNFPPPPDAFQEPAPPPPPPAQVWSTVLDGADASVVNNGGGSFTCNGPNDNGGTGWAYIYTLFTSAGSFTYNFTWFTSDGIIYDWPFEFVTSSDPSNPGNVNFTTKIASTNSQSGSRTVSYGANQYVVLGVYSVDSVFGNGVCTFSALP